MKKRLVSIGFGLFCLGVMGPVGGMAQTLSVLHSFAVPAETPVAPLTQGPDGTLYGTASAGGAGGYGTVFRVRPDGTGFTNLYNFDGGADGGTPYGGLVLAGNFLLGTTSAGGGSGNGTVFQVDTNGNCFNLLWDFSAGGTNAAGIMTNLDGSASQAGLLLAGGNLFGTTYSGGTTGSGVVFMLSTNGGDLTTLWDFSAGVNNADGVWTNAEGGTPQGGLVLAGTNLYGTTYQGGTNGSGTVFALGTNGGGITLLRTFAATDLSTGANSDGANPFASLTLSGTTLFGTAEGGGTAGDGTVFALFNLGGKFSVLWSFSATDANTGTNADGAFPDCSLVLAGNFLFGTTYAGGGHGNGSVFTLNTSGSQFTNFYSFSTGPDGANPDAGLLLFGATLYGTASAGGNWGEGTAFAINTNGAGFTNFYIFDSEDGVQPTGGLLLAANTFYGTTAQGGSNNSGMVFKMNTNGTGFTVLKSFSALDPNTGTNHDGAAPMGNLVLSGGTLFGTTSAGGSNGTGTVFALGTNGGGFSLLWSAGAGETNAFGFLTNATGAYPEAGLTLAGSLLFGTTYEGGVFGAGTVFVIGTNGGGLKSLTHFSAGNYNADGFWTNTDGGTPAGTLVFTGTNLFGVAYQGGSAGDGTVFRLGTNGGGFTVLKTFSATDVNTGTNTDGANPYAGLTLAGTNLFGTDESGGTGGSGTVFVLSTNAGKFSVLWNFSATNANTGTNTDGANPDGALVLSGNTLFGASSAGGFWGGGTIFAVNTNGGALTNLQNLFPATDGETSYANLVLSGSTLAGAASQGGPGGGGTIFDLTTVISAVPLSIQWSGFVAEISWPSPSLGFALEENPNLSTTNWTIYPGMVSDDGSTRSVLLAPGTGGSYFRLYHP